MQSADLALRLFPSVSGPHIPLDNRAAISLRAGAASDAAWSYRSSILSIVASLNALEAGYRSWPVVQLYYSVFYSVRSILLSNSICLYHNSSKPMQIEGVAGQVPRQLTFKGAGSSHIGAFRVFSSKFPENPLNGEIDFEPATDWMRRLRETVNYQQSQMNMDDRLRQFTRVDREGVRRALGAYLQDIELYAFLPEDAALAFPLYAAQQALRSLPVEARRECRDLVQDIAARARDGTGALASFVSFVPELAT